MDQILSQDPVLHIEKVVVRARKPYRVGARGVVVLDTFGTPVVEGAKVTAMVKEHYRDKKLIVQKFKRRKDYRRKQGHRQQHTRLSITSILAD